MKQARSTTKKGGKGKTPLRDDAFKKKFFMVGKRNNKTSDRRVPTISEGGTRIEERKRERKKKKKT